MKKILYLLLLLLPSFAFATAEDDLKAGNEAYKLAKFEEALQHYEKIPPAGRVSWAVYYNIGNAHYKLEQLPQAILNYEKALRLDPSNEDIRHNLKLAGSQITDKRASFTDTGLMGILENIMNTFSTDGWAWMSILLFFAMFISFFLVYVLRNKTLKSIFFGLTFAWLFAGGVAVVFSQVQYGAYHHAAAIVMEPAVNVTSEPNESSTALFILHGGSKVDLLESSGDWQKVKYEGEKIGWVPKSVFAEI